MSVKGYIQLISPIKLGFTCMKDETLLTKYIISHYILPLIGSGHVLLDSSNYEQEEEKLTEVNEQILSSVYELVTIAWIWHECLDPAIQMVYGIHLDV